MSKYTRHWSRIQQFELDCHGVAYKVIGHETDEQHLVRDILSWIKLPSSSVYIDSYQRFPGTKITKRTLKDHLKYCSEHSNSGCSLYLSSKGNEPDLYIILESLPSMMSS